jgi:VWFA-related protein
VRRRFAILSIVILVASATLNGQGRPAEFKADVNLVTLFVTVTDESGRRAADLDRSAFKVYEDGTRRDIAAFESRAASPLSVALLIDTSLSTSGELKREREAASRFVHALADGGSETDIALYAFDWRVSRKAGFTRDADRLERQVRSIKGEAGTVLYDAVCLASRDIQPRPGRHIIVVVTDGVDTASGHSFSQAAEAARLASSAVFPILVAPVANDLAGEHALIALAADTGGRVFRVTEITALDGAFRNLAQQLGAQYLIGYYRPKAADYPGKIAQIRIELARPHLTATVYRDSCANGSEPDAVCR